MAYEPPKRPVTHLGPRNEDRRDRLNPPRGVGLTEPPVNELAIPHEVDDPGTGVLEGAALWDKRRKRPTEERLDHADERLDKLVDELLASRKFMRDAFWKLAAIAGPIITYLLTRGG